MDKLNQVLKDIYMDSDDELFNISNAYIYHYTRTENLTSILIPLETGVNADNNGNGCHVKLRFSDDRCLNDYTENFNALDVFRRVCETSFESDGKFLAVIKDLTPSDTPCLVPEQRGEDVTISGRNIPCSRFICCFSTDGDILPMWTYYSRSSHYEGYSIGFNAGALLNDLALYFATEYQAFYVTMVYEDDEKEKIVYDTLMKIHDNMEYNDEQISEVQQFIRQRLWFWSLKFKNSSFKHEKEIRAVLDVPNEKAIDAQRFYSKPNSLKFGYHTTHGLLVPHIDVNFSSEVFDSIIIGPFTNSQIDRDSQKAILTKYLSDSGFICTPDYTVKFSEVPVRY